MFCNGRGKRGAHVEKGKGPWQGNVVINSLNETIFGEENMKTREDKRMIKLIFYLYFKTIVFGHIF